MARKKTELSLLFFLLSSAMIVFAYGFAAGYSDIFPSRLIRKGIHSLLVVWHERGIITRTRPHHHVRPSRHNGAGVTRAIEGKIQPGLTLLAGFFTDTNELRLIRTDGTLVQRWPVSFYGIFEAHDHFQPADSIPATDWNTDLHGVVAHPDGSVAFNFEYGGTVKLDRCGEVLWTIPRMTHHSIERSDAGTYWIPSRNWVQGVSGLPPIEVPYSEDTLLEVSPEGVVLREISVPDLFLSDDLRAVLFLTGMKVASVPGWHREIVHLNDIEPLPEEMADRFPMFGAGDLLVSLRNRNLVMVLDAATAQVKWHQIGPWIRQHDPDFNPDGTISVFNNNTDDSDGALFGGSSILKLVPGDDGATATHALARGERWYTESRGTHQNLANGNILLVESGAGRVMEVTQSGEVVWEYINRYDDDEVALVNNAIRYPEEYFTVADWSCSR